MIHPTVTPDLWVIFLCAQVGMRPDQRLVDMVVARIEKVLHNLVGPEQVRGRPAWRVPAWFTYTQSRGLVFDAPDGDKVHVDVEVKTARGTAPRGMWHDQGRGDGPNRGGAVILMLPVGWLWDADAVEGTLTHELTHAIDPDLHRRKHRPSSYTLTEQGGVREQDAGAYANDPAEIRAVMSNIQRRLHSKRVRELVSLWSTKGFPWSPGRLPTTALLAQTLLEEDSEMARIGRFLTPANRSMIKRMAEQEVQDVLHDLGTRRVARRWIQARG